MTNYDKYKHAATLFRGSIYGALAWSAASSLNQDLLGRDAYIQLVQERLIDARVTIPIAIIMLAIVGAAYCVDVICYDKRR